MESGGCALYQSIVEALAKDISSGALPAGTQHALLLILLTVLSKGDTLLADSHSFPGLNAMARFLDLNLIGVPADGEGLLPEALETACARRKVGALYCNPTLHNPTAKTMTEPRREAVAAVAAGLVVRAETRGRGPGKGDHYLTGRGFCA